MSDNNIPPNGPLAERFDGGSLDLASIPGVREHFVRTGDLPILVFRAARAIRVVLNPFPGIWRMSSSRDSRSLIAGRNTFAQALEVKAGDEISIVPIMSAVTTSAPRIQVPAELPNDIGTLEAPDEVAEADDSEDLDAIDTLTEANVEGGESDAKGPDDEDVEAALSDLMEPVTENASANATEPASHRRSSLGLVAGWFTVAHVGGVA